MPALNSAVKKDLIKRISNLSSPLEIQPTKARKRLNSLKNIKAVIFDVYGTMILSGSGDIGVTAEGDKKTEAVRDAAKALNQHNIEDMAEDAVELLQSITLQVHEEAARKGVEKAEVVMPEIWQEVFEGLEEPGCIVSLPDKNTLLKFIVEYECRVNPSWPVPGLQNTLKAIRDRQIKLGIVSNAQFFTPLLFEAFLDSSLDELGFEQDLRIWSYMLRVAKPSTAIYTPLVFNLKQQYDIHPEEVLYVGNDMLNDIYPAHAMGMKTALYAADRRSLRWREDDERVAGLEPDAIITDLPQILEVVG